MSLSALLLLLLTLTRSLARLLALSSSDSRSLQQLSGLRRSSSLHSHSHSPFKLQPWFACSLPLAPSLPAADASVSFCVAVRL